MSVVGSRYNSLVNEDCKKLKKSVSYIDFKMLIGDSSIVTCSSDPKIFNK
jgi:hypothetical protein